MTKKFFSHFLLRDNSAGDDALVRVEHEHLTWCRCKLWFVKLHADCTGGGVEFRNSCCCAFVPEANVSRERFF